MMVLIENEGKFTIFWKAVSSAPMTRSSAVIVS